MSEGIGYSSSKNWQLKIGKDIRKEEPKKWSFDENHGGYFYNEDKGNGCLHVVSIPLTTTERFNPTGFSSGKMI